MDWKQAKSVASELEMGRELGPETMKSFGEFVSYMMDRMSKESRNEARDRFVDIFNVKSLNDGEGYWIALHAAEIFSRVTIKINNQRDRRQAFEEFKTLIANEKDPVRDLKRILNPVALIPYIGWVRDRLDETDPRSLEAWKRCYLEKEAEKAKTRSW